MNITQLLDALSSQTKADASDLVPSSVPNKAGLYVWYSTLTGEPVYVGSAVGVGGLRRRICQQHLNPRYLERRASKFTSKDWFQLENPILPNGVVAIDKSAFRKNLARSHGLKAGQESVDYIKANFCLAFVVLLSYEPHRIKKLEAATIRTLGPTYNLRGQVRS